MQQPEVWNSARRKGVDIFNRLRVPIYDGFTGALAKFQKEGCQKIKIEYIERIGSLWSIYL